MGNQDKLKEYAKVLQEVDVSEIVTSMALGIAEAQEKLDNNSVRQVLALADPDNGIGGKSLLELGFTPAFYSFQYADIRAAISLKMKEKESIDFGVELEAEYAKQSGYSKSNYEFMKEGQNDEYRSEFKSSKDVVMKTSESKGLVVRNRTVRMNQEEGAVTKIENFRKEIESVENVSRAVGRVQESNAAIVNQSSAGVLVYNMGGYITIKLPDTTNDKGILKLGEYNTDEAIIDDSPNHRFSMSGTFADVYGRAVSQMAGGGKIMGFSKANFYPGTGSTATALEIFYDYNQDKFSTAYTGYGNNASAMAGLDFVAAILRADTSAIVKLTGYTDGSGTNKYNIDLSGRRIDDIKKWLMRNGASSTQINADPQGEVLALGSSARDAAIRKVSIAFTSAADYIYFEGGTFDIDTNSPAFSAVQAKNAFIGLSAGTAGGSTNVSFSLGGTVFTLSGSTYQQLVNSVRTTYNATFDAEYYNGMAYLLHNETVVKFTALSSDMKEIEMKEESSSESTTTQSNSSYLLSKDVNELSRMKEDSEKLSNPSSIAVGGSIDFRYARQYELSMEGTASVSARLISLPAPAEFLDHVKDFLTQ